MFGRKNRALKHAIGLAGRGCAPIPFAGHVKRRGGPHRHNRRPHALMGPIQGRGCL
ncbi:hypothetical protein [Butyrivibrio sp. WCE2006]|uniref:hypothetical protein n=1 Tax=Butyrivibrio sp. WCE2006 TaxID=1410611 RepID=UPI000A48C784|nr:hypothetical protein [Butyrivibrio sp. WCE2006]